MTCAIDLTALPPPHHFTTSRPNHLTLTVWLLWHGYLSAQLSFAVTPQLVFGIEKKTVVHRDLAIVSKHVTRFGSPLSAKCGQTSVYFFFVVEIPRFLSMCMSVNMWAHLSIDTPEFTPVQHVGVHIQYKLQYRVHMAVFSQSICQYSIFVIKLGLSSTQFSGGDRSTWGAPLSVGPSWAVFWLYLTLLWIWAH